MFLQKPKEITADRRCFCDEFHHEIMRWRPRVPVLMLIAWRPQLPTYHKGGSLESDICDMSVGGTVGFPQSAWSSKGTVGQHAKRKRSVSSLGAVASNYKPLKSAESSVWRRIDEAGNFTGCESELFLIGWIDSLQTPLSLASLLGGRRGRTRPSHVKNTT